MTRFLQISFVILAALLCAGLAACQSQKNTNKIISGNLIESTLKSTFLDSNIYIQDNFYFTVSEFELWNSIDNGWKPFIKESGDCDDQASDILYYLRLSFRNLGYPPAAGRINGFIRETPHCAIWYVNNTGKLKFLDPTSLTPLHEMQIKAKHIFDK